MIDHGGEITAASLRRDLKWHRDGGRGGGVVVEDDISGQFTRLSRDAFESAINGTAAALRFAAGHRLCRDRRSHRDDSSRGGGGFWHPAKWMAIKIQLIRGDRIAQYLSTRTDFLFSITAVQFWLMAGIAVAIGLVVRSDEVTGALIQSGQNAATLSWQISGVLLITKLIHELAHAAVCRRSGAAVRSMGVMLFCGMPCPFCDVTDAWRLKNRHRRAAVMAAGVYAEWVIATIAGMIFLAVQHEPTRQVAVIAIIVCFGGSVIFNANPLMRYDGYYVLADWLGSVNLSAESAAAFRTVVTERLIGSTPATPSRLKTPSTLKTPKTPGASAFREIATRRRIGLAIYFVFKVIYRVVVMASIAGLMIYFGGVIGMQRAAIGLVVMMFAAAASRPIVSTLRLVHLGSNGRGGASPPWWRRCLVAMIVPVTVGGLLTIELPHWTCVPGRVIPTRVQWVESPVDGVIASMRIQSGQTVSAGDSMVTIDSEPLRLRELTLRNELAVTQSRLRSTEREMAFGDDLAAPRTSVGTGEQNDRASGIGSAAMRWRGLEQQSQSLQSQLKSLREQIDSTTVQADFDGIVLPPANATVPAATRPSPNDVGGVVAKGQAIARVANDRWCVEIDWPLADHPAVAINDPVSVTVRQPDGTIRQTTLAIESISPIRQSAPGGRNDPSPTGQRTAGRTAIAGTGINGGTGNNRISTGRAVDAAMVRLRCVGETKIEIPAARLPQWYDSTTEARVIHPPRSIASRAWRWTQRYAMAEAWR